LRSLLKSRAEDGDSAIGANKTTAALSEPPLSFQTSRSRVYIPLEHFFAVASHFIPAFSHAACVLGVPANAGAVKATTRPNARIETNVFIRISSDAVTSQASQYKTSLRWWCCATQCRVRRGLLPQVRTTRRKSKVGILYPQRLRGVSILLAWLCCV
jgi:hypothetical protein